MNSEDRKRLRKQKHRIMMMRLWLPVVLVVVLVVGLTAGGIAMSLGQTKSVAEQGTKEDGTKNVETKEASNESKKQAMKMVKHRLLIRQVQTNSSQKRHRLEQKVIILRLAMRMMTAIMR